MGGHGQAPAPEIRSKRRGILRGRVTDFGERWVCPCQRSPVDHSAGCQRGEEWPIAHVGYLV